MVQPAPAFDSASSAALSAGVALGTQERAVLNVLVANRNRVSEEIEVSGLDIPEMGVAAYND